MDQMKDKKSQQLKIELPEKEAEGIYSNLAIITHSPAEFVLDFTRVVPGVPKAKVLSRIITTPQHAKMLLKALQDNIKKFESRFGEIKVEGQAGHQFGFSNVEKDNTIN
ncbi:MAG: DUF3467 domain-containing protein [Melioribacteraceae bacterium]|nr:DUF3467 domain-containing protein [Melioribacteraceae bacterium]